MNALNKQNHKWYKGVPEKYGDYIYRDDECDCGCVRRTVLNNENKEEIESYTKKDNTTIKEPKCDAKRYKRVYGKCKRKGKGGNAGSGSANRENG